MTRLQVIQTIVDATKAERYLEIGVAFGDVFFNVRVRRKTAVDPVFRFSTRTVLKSIFRSPCNIRNLYFRGPSDMFFSSLGPGRTGLQKFDVVFIDGLHTYDQCLRDCENSLRHLNPGGVILLHDCNPPTRAAADPAPSHAAAGDRNLSGWTGEWCGDVWKAIVDLRSSRPDLSLFVLDCDYGIGVVIKRPSATFGLQLPSDVCSLDYNYFDGRRVQLLDLRPPSYLDEFVATLTTASKDQPQPAPD